MLLSSTHHLVLSRYCSFPCLSVNRSVVLSSQVLFILSSLASLFNRSAVQICSSLFLVYLVSTRVVPIPSCPLYSSFIALQPPRFTWCTLFLFSTAMLSIVFNSVVFFQHFNLSRFVVSLVRQRSNLVLPPLLLVHFPPVPS